MPNETLENLLQADCTQHDRESLSIEEIQEILEILDLRAKSNIPSPRRTPEMALADALACAEEPLAESPISDPIQSPKSKHHLSRKIGWLIAVVALFASCTISAAAFELNIFKMLATWTADTFQFVGVYSGGEDEVVAGNDDLAEVRSQVDELYGISITPTWCPEEYNITDFSQISLTTKQLTMVTLSDGENELIFSVTQYNNGITDSTSISEKMDGDVYEFVCGDITHYIVKNDATITALWCNEDFECYLSGDVPITTIEQMIESIY